MSTAGEDEPATGRSRSATKAFEIVMSVGGRLLRSTLTEMVWVALWPSASVTWIWKLSWPTKVGSVRA